MAGQSEDLRNQEAENEGMPEEGYLGEEAGPSPLELPQQTYASRGGEEAVSEMARQKGMAEAGSKFVGAPVVPGAGKAPGGRGGEAQKAGAATMPRPSRKGATTEAERTAQVTQQMMEQQQRQRQQEGKGKQLKSMMAASSKGAALKKAKHRLYLRIATAVAPVCFYSCLIIIGILIVVIVVAALAAGVSGFLDSLKEAFGF